MWRRAAFVEFFKSLSSLGPASQLGPSRGLQSAFLSTLRISQSRELVFSRFLVGCGVKRCNSTVAFQNEARTTEPQRESKRQKDPLVEMRYPAIIGREVVI
jgi:hypothetical protein